MLMLQKNPINYLNINKNFNYNFYFRTINQRNNSYGKIVKNNGIIKINENENENSNKNENKNEPTYN